MGRKVLTGQDAEDYLLAEIEKAEEELVDHVSPFELDAINEFVNKFSGDSGYDAIALRFDVQELKLIARLTEFSLYRLINRHVEKGNMERTVTIDTEHDDCCDVCTRITL